VLGFLAWRAIRTGRSSAVRSAAAALAVLLVAQWTVGPLMVLKALPLELATTHNAIAALLVLTMVALLRFLWTPRTLR
jgi:cytochrome c oxidase assembly protein subunit 15